MQTPTYVVPREALEMASASGLDIITDHPTPEGRCIAVRGGAADILRLAAELARHADWANWEPWELVDQMSVDVRESDGVWYFPTLTAPL